MKLGFWQSIVVDSSGASGGLCFMWIKEVVMVPRSFCFHHIDTEVKVIRVLGCWRLIGFYRYPVTADQHKSWELLASLGDASFMAWLCVGDFNEVFWADEKLGGRVRNDRQIQGFRYAIDYCGLQELGFMGPKFTWWRNNPEDIRVRLDRALTNIEWSERFSGSTVFHLNPTKSDHLPIKIIISKQILNQS